MNQIEELYEIIKSSETAILATCSDNKVTMRTISPVFYENKILFFTNPKSNKYNQLKNNPNCCISIGNYFVEAISTLCGSTLLDSNSKLKEAYVDKFKDAFDEEADFGGNDSDFILLEPKKVTGWEVDKTSGSLFPFSIDL